MTRRTVGDFGEVFRQEHHRALRLAFVLTGDAHAAEDLVAEAFAAMFRQWRRGRVDDPTRYLQQTIANGARSRWRRIGVERRHAARGSEPARHEPGTDSIDERDRLRSALLRLPPRQRAVVVLRVMEDLAEAETAAVLGVSVGTVKAQLSRGVERLRELLDEGSHDA